MTPPFEAFSRLTGAAITTGLIAYFAAYSEALDQGPNLWLAAAWICPLVAIAFSVPRLDIRTCLSNGIAGAPALAFGYVMGHQPELGTSESYPGLASLYLCFAALACLAAGIALLAMFNLVCSLARRRSHH